MKIKEIIEQLINIKNNVNELIKNVNYWDYSIVDNLENVIKELNTMINELKQGETND